MIKETMVGGGTAFQILGGPMGSTVPNDDLVARLRTITVADSANIIYKTMAEAADEIERLKASIGRVRELHIPSPHYVYECGDSIECDECGGVDYPCPTIEALGGDKQ